MTSKKPRRYVVAKSTMKSATAAAGTLVAAATLAAITAFAPASSIPTQSVTASSRMSGVHQDLARAVALNQVTAEQAKRFEEQLTRRIAGSSSSADEA
ncbi:MAG: hypothetical protein HIU81_00740 [Acidobacteria bacterium]|nr:hypothetical protein [Acidobacteriota bacterium]